MENTEFDLIAEVQIKPHEQMMDGWDVVIQEVDGMSYVLAHYHDMNGAFERARLVHSYCEQPITIRIVQENGDSVAIECEKLTNLNVMAMTHHIYIYFNGRTQGWEMFHSDGHSNIVQTIDSEEQAVEFANFIETLNPDCVVDHDIRDNTCRTRGCQWNLEDACTLRPRSFTLPEAELDLTVEEWTVDNHPTPRSCIEYHPIDEGAGLS